MVEIIDFSKGSKNPKTFFECLTYKALFAKDNPDYFYPSGIWVFCGPQGSGKTISAVQCLFNLLKEYPKAKVVSNLDIKGIDYIPFESYDQLSNLSNGTNGIVFLLDEIHVLWNSLESRDIPISEMACFCQMRKDRRVIIGTSQCYHRIAKPIREQLQYVVDCKNFFGIVQMNTFIDPVSGKDDNGLEAAEVLGRNFWFHSPGLYNSYDTLFKIKKAKRGA